MTAQDAHGSHHDRNNSDHDHDRSAQEPRGHDQSPADHETHQPSRAADGDGHGHDHDHGDGHRHAEEDNHRHPMGVRGFFYGLFVPHTHDPHDAIDDALEASTAGIRAVKVSLVVLAVTAGLQIIVVLISGSVALLADTIHNFADALTRSRCGSRLR